MNRIYRMRTLQCASRQTLANRHSTPGGPIPHNLARPLWSANLIA